MATTTTKPKAKTHVGQSIRRQEDPRLITGTATYVDDIQRPSMLYAAVLRSPYAAANIKSVSTAGAMEMPGVKAVYTGKDVSSVGPVPCAGSMPTLRVPPHTILATDRVYYVGHPVAAVVASDRYVAQDALERIAVDYEPLDDVVSDPEKALEKDSRKVHPEYEDNVAFTFHLDGGDVEKAFAEADKVVKLRVAVPRLAPSPIETRGVVAAYDEGAKELTIYSSTQIPHLLRTQLALQLNFPEHHLRVIAPEVGGGFGSKCNVWAEEALAGYGLGARLEFLMIPVIFGIGAAMTAMVGANMGAGQVDRALRVAWTGSCAAAVIVGGIGLLLAVFPDLWLGMFLDPSNTGALDAGRSYFRLVAPFYAFFALGLALYFASQGAGHMVWPVVSSLSRMAVALIGALILMQTGGLGLRGIFIAIGGAMVVYGTVIGLAIWRRGWRARA